MVRTDKPPSASAAEATATSAAAMDALNLDDLFLGGDEGGDSLFDDMDVDLGDMDIIMKEEDSGIGIESLDNDVLKAGDSAVENRKQKKTKKKKGKKGKGRGSLTFSDDEEDIVSGIDAEVQGVLRARSPKPSGRLSPSTASTATTDEASSAKSTHTTRSKTRRKKDSAAAVDASSSSPPKAKTRKSGRETKLSSKARESTQSSLSSHSSSFPLGASAAADASVSSSDGGIGRPKLGGRGRGSLPTQKRKQMQQLQQQQSLRQLDHHHHHHQQQQSMMPAPADRTGGVGLLPPPPSSQPPRRRGATFGAAVPPASSDSPPKGRKRSSSSKVVQQMEGTFCGLAPSKTLFYPYLPSLPSEVGMKRSHKMFPQLDKINASASSEKGATAAAAESKKSVSSSTTQAVSEKDALFSLFVKHLGVLEQHGHGTHPQARGGDGNGAAATDTSASSSTAADNSHKEAELAAALTAAREVASQANRAELAIELRSILSVVTRQGDFLRQSLVNMERWCKDHFSEADYLSAFPAAVRQLWDKTKAPSGVVIAQRGTVRAAIRVKIKCAGFKEPTMARTLVAYVPMPHGQAAPAVGKIAAPTLSGDLTAHPSTAAPAPTVKSRKRKAPVAKSPDKVKSSAVQELRLVDLTPAGRRKRVVDVVRRNVRRLNDEWRSEKDKCISDLRQAQSKLQKIVDDDKEAVAVCHTQALWRWFEGTPYLADLSRKDVKDVLDGAWQPEMSDRAMYWGRLPKAHVESWLDIRGTAEGVKKEEKEPAPSLFDRLQSLLVEEGENTDTEEDSRMKRPDGDAYIRLKENHVEEAEIDYLHDCPSQVISRNSTDYMLDVSELSLDQRAYLHLRAARLVDNPLLLSTRPLLVERCGSSDANGRIDVLRRRQQDTGPVPSASTPSPVENEESDIDEVLRRMQMDLSEMHRRNNTQTALLQSRTEAYFVKRRRAKIREEEDSVSLSKYTQLRKKQKEAVRTSSRPKSSSKTDDEDWLPW